MSKKFNKWFNVHKYQALSAVMVVGLMFTGMVASYNNTNVQTDVLHGAATESEQNIRLDFNIQGNTLNLEWTKLDENTGYRLYYSETNENPDETNGTKIYEGKSFGVTFSPLQNGYYRVMGETNKEISVSNGVYIKK